MRSELDKIATEQRNPLTERIDELGTLDMVTLTNSKDHKAAEAVKQMLPRIATAVDIMTTN